MISSQTSDDELMDQIMLEVTARYPGFEVAELTKSEPGDRRHNDGATAWLALRGLIMTEHQIRGEASAVSMALKLIAPYILHNRRERDPRAVNEALKALHGPGLCGR